MICMNTILVILGLFILGAGLYLSVGKGIPPVLDVMSRYLTVITWFGVALVVFGVLGYCAACGGCFLFVYVLVITLCTVCCLIALIGTIVGFFALKNEAFLDQIDNSTMTIVESEEYAEQWKEIQDKMKCCGYKGVAETGSSCTEESVDCRNTFLELLNKYIVRAIIVALITFIVVLLLNIGSCSILKNDCRP